MLNSNWQLQHRGIMEAAITYINSVSRGFILKGGTSLMFCYGLDRFSEDIDLDSTTEDIIPIMNTFCSINGLAVNINKNTNTVKRCMIHYGGAKPLKIEVSYRAKFIPSPDISVINGILVYNIDKLMQLKCAAYQGRDKLRDLYDIVFIGNNYFNQLSPATITVLQTAFMYKGLDWFDYLVRNQTDELINNDTLAENLLILWDRLGLN